MIKKIKKTITYKNKKSFSEIVPKRKIKRVKLRAHNYIQTWFCLGNTSYSLEEYIKNYCMNNKKFCLKQAKRLYMIQTGRIRRLLWN